MAEIGPVAIPPEGPEDVPDSPDGGIRVSVLDAGERFLSDAGALYALLTGRVAAINRINFEVIEAR